MGRALPPSLLVMSGVPTGGVSLAVQLEVCSPARLVFALLLWYLCGASGYMWAWKFVLN